MARSEQSKEYHREYMKEKGQLGREALQIVNDMSDKLKSIDFSKLQSLEPVNTEDKLQDLKTPYLNNAQLNNPQSRKILLGIIGLMLTGIVIYWLLKSGRMPSITGNGITVVRE